MKHNWTYKPLAHLCNVFVDGDWIESKDQSNSGIRLIQTGNIGVGVYLDKTERSKFISEETFYSLNCTEIFEGDILISRLPDPIGRACILPKLSSRAITAVDVAIVRPKSEILPRFVLHYTKSENYADWIATFTKGSTRKRVSRKNLGSIKFPVPPLEVQRHIVVELDKIYNAIEDCREVLHNLDALAQSLFFVYFGDPVTNPKGWEVKNLVDICDAISTGITYKPDNVADNGTIVLRSSNIQDSEFLLDDIVRIDLQLKPSQYVKKNDILMCSRNGSARLVGKVALIPELNENMSWGAFMTIIRSDFYHFLLQYFRLPAFRQQLKKTKTTTVNQITIGMLKNIQLPVPSLELQEKFSERIEQIDAQKKAVKETIAELQTLLDSRMDYWFN